MIFSARSVAGPYRFPPSKVAAASVIKILIRWRVLERRFDAPPIARVAFGFRLTRGRADIALFHDDRSVTLVKLRGPDSARRLLVGMWQLKEQATRVPATLAPTSIRLVLAATVPVDEAMSDLCSRSDITFVALGSPRENAAVWADFSEALAERRAARDQA